MQFQGSGPPALPANACHSYRCGLFAPPNSLLNENMLERPFRNAYDRAKNGVSIQALDSVSEHEKNRRAIDRGQLNGGSFDYRSPVSAPKIRIRYPIEETSIKDFLTTSKSAPILGYKALLSLANWLDKRCESEAASRLEPTSCCATTAADCSAGSAGKTSAEDSPGGRGASR